jgi:hypothetical protein
MENVATILDNIMADRTPGQDMTMEKLEQCAVPSEYAEYAHDYDLREATHTKYEHTTYQADPYYGTVGWFKFLKGKGKKTVAAGRNDEGAYECLLLKKVTKHIKDNGSVEFNEFAMNIPVSMIPVLTLVFNKLLLIKEECSNTAREAAAAIAVN